jgi:hypothetical protein
MTAEKQIEQYKTRQKVYQKQLKALELTINQKELEISQLKKVSNNNNNNNNNSSSSRSAVETEEKSEKGVLRPPNKNHENEVCNNNNTSTSTTASNNELKILKHEYEKLQAKMNKDQNQQKDLLETLQQQIFIQNEKSMETMHQVKDLEKKNSELLERLQKVNKEKLSMKKELIEKDQAFHPSNSSSIGSGRNSSRSNNTTPRINENQANRDHHPSSSSAAAVVGNTPRRSSVPINLNATTAGVSSTSDKNDPCRPSTASSSNNNKKRSLVNMSGGSTNNNKLQEAVWNNSLKHITHLAAIKQAL